MGCDCFFLDPICLLVRRCESIFWFILIKCDFCNLMDFMMCASVSEQRIAVKTINLRTWTSCCPIFCNILLFQTKEFIPKNYRHHHYYVPYHFRLPESAFTQEKTIFEVQLFEFVFWQLKVKRRKLTQT